MKANMGSKLKVLFVVADVYFSEPLGIMILSAICKKKGYPTRLGIVARENLIEILNDFQPDVIAYSTMTSDENSFAHANDIIQAWSKNTVLPNR